MKHVRRAGPILGLALCAAVLVLTLTHARAALQWLSTGGWRALIAFALLYLSATLLLVPPGILNAVAGALFGLGRGMAVVSCANLAAAVLAFMLSRAGGRRWAQRHIERRQRLLAVDLALERGGFKLVFLLRCSPVSPFAVVNYLLGLTRVRFRDYVLGTVAGAAPGTLALVYAGSAAASAADLLAHGIPRAAPGPQLLFWMGLAATALAFALLTCYARRGLRTARNGSSYTGSRCV
jgi:uncharacterized membrane protein YdjX (TVP38/TMEM64 family)